MDVVDLPDTDAAMKWRVERLPSSGVCQPGYCRFRDRLDLLPFKFNILIFNDIFIFLH
jgi:hypothetical protein